MKFRRYQPNIGGIGLRVLEALISKHLISALTSDVTYQHGRQNAKLSFVNLKKTQTYGNSGLANQNTAQQTLIYLYICEQLSMILKCLLAVVDQY